MNTGGRRRPLGPLARGLSCCALVLAVLGLWLGAATGRSATVDHTTPSVSHSVAALQVPFRAPAPDVEAISPHVLVVAVVLAGVLIGTTRVARRVPVRRDPRHGRAPPGCPGSY